MHSNPCAAGYAIVSRWTMVGFLRRRCIFLALGATECHSDGPQARYWGYRDGGCHTLWGRYGRKESPWGIPSARGFSILPSKPM